MISAILSTALGGGQALPPAPAPDTLAACYLQTVDLSKRDPRDPDKLTPSGPSRLLVVEFQSPAANSDNAASGMKMYDPTGMMLNRTIVKTVYRNNAYGLIANGGTEDAFAMLIEEPESGKQSQRAVITRAQKGKPLSYMLAGRCLVTKPSDPDGDFEQWKTQPESRQ